jgi:hypothetical protein
MVRWRVHRVELQRQIAGSIDHIVVRARGDNNGIRSMRQKILRTFEDESGFTLFEAEELIDIRMHLPADLLARLQAHHHQLAELPGEEHLPEVPVLEG